MNLASKEKTAAVKAGSRDARYFTRMVQPLKGQPQHATMLTRMAFEFVAARSKAAASLPLQPPTIPHRVDGYQVDKNFNKCLDCHARAKTAFSQAVPVSETHYIDRSGKVLDHVSTRRYFCPQCHVAQDPVRPLVGNSFENVDALARQAGDASKAKPK